MPSVVEGPTVDEPAAPLPAVAIVPAPAPVPTPAAGTAPGAVGGRAAGCAAWAGAGAAGPVDTAASWMAAEEGAPVAAAP
jgi:hypothetical protein